MDKDTCTAEKPDINAKVHNMEFDGPMEYHRTGTLYVRMLCPDCGLKVVYTTHAVIET